MSSKREEERNEKIIRGLMKLPPNRRCINCNSLGPQYVCTNFWTFICTTCSGIHREFTHRVKSVSMAKFTSQEVDALQKGGNQRAREIFFGAWDPQSNRLPDNSNVDKVREFIKNVYVDKKYSLEKSSDRPPRGPQSLRGHEDEMRRASSYHSYSQSPPYDFQYEERRYGKQAPALSRQPGSDRGLYEGKLASFLSPTRLSDYANNHRSSNEGSYPRVSDVSGGGDILRCDVLSPSCQIDTGSPFSETSSDISRETSLHNSDANSRSNGGRKLHPQHSSVGRTFDGLDLFSTPFAPQNATSIHPTGSNSQLLQPSMALQRSLSSVLPLTEQQSSQIPQHLPLDLFAKLSQQQSAASSNRKASDVLMPNDGGWATFDMPQNGVSMGTEYSTPAVAPSSDGKVLGNFNPFSVDQSSSFQDSSGHAPSSSAQSESLQSVQTTNDAHHWNAFDNAATGDLVLNGQKRNEQTALHSASDAGKSLHFGGYEALNDKGNVRAPIESEPPASSLSLHFSTTLNDIPMISAVAGVHLFATDHKPGNPFDLPYESDMESTNMSQFWNMNSLQAALPNTETPTSYIGGVHQPWFPQNSVPSFVPAGVPFHPSAGSLGFIAGQSPSNPIMNMHAQGPVASLGGNPFA